MSNKSILITGCSGYIGSHLCRVLSDKYDVYGLDIKEPDNQAPLKSFYNADIRHYHSIRNGLCRHNYIVEDNQFKYTFDTIIHLAALVRVNESVQQPYLYYNTNITGTYNILTHFKCNNFIYASTGAVEYLSSPYAISKKAGEDIVKQYRGNNSFTTFRFYNVIGTKFGLRPTNPDGLLYNLIKAKETKKLTIFGNDYMTADGTCSRDYVHVMEICNAISLAIEKPSNKIECLGTGKGHTVKQIAELYKKVNKCEFEIEYGSRREGDLPVSVLKNVSPYMKKLYSIDDLLKEN
jgi:UDP-glucose 4-epimerase